MFSHSYFTFAVLFVGDEVDSNPLISLALPTTPYVTFRMENVNSLFSFDFFIFLTDIMRMVVGGE